MKQCSPILYIFMVYWVFMCPTVYGDPQYRGRKSKVMRDFGGLFPFDQTVQPTESSLIPQSFQLNSPCKSSFDCLSHVPHSHCDYETRVCVCQNYHVAYNSTLCLPASLLGYPCVMDAQCQMKVLHSLCVEGLCGCEANHTPLRKDKCLPPAAVGQYCLNDVQCMTYSRYSFCRYIIPRIYGRCNCPAGFHVTTDGYCLPQLGSYCEKTEDCETVTANSHCAPIGYSYECACREGLEPTADNLECIFDRTTALFGNTAEDKTAHISLGKACISDVECQNRDPNSHCLNGTCDCLAPDDTCSAQNPGCHSEAFQCRNGYCISWFFVCDGFMNCADNSDEDECHRYNCPKEAFTCDEGTCLPRSSICNGFWECPDGSDEARCYTGIPCDKDAFRCRNGQCLPAYSFCNAILDCADGTDEIAEVCDGGVNCSSIFPHTHQCLNGRCRSSAVPCSGQDGCGDGSDEDKCEVCQCKKP